VSCWPFLATKLREHGFGRKGAKRQASLSWSWKKEAPVHQSLIQSVAVLRAEVQSWTRVAACLFHCQRFQGSPLPVSPRNHGPCLNTRLCDLLTNLDPHLDLCVLLDNPTDQAPRIPDRGGSRQWAVFVGRCNFFGGRCWSLNDWWNQR
jgi:hypothetical protein